MAASTTAGEESVSSITPPGTPEVGDIGEAISSRWDATGELQRAWEKGRVNLKESPPQDAREIGQPPGAADSQDIRDVVNALARRARDSFRNACEATDEDGSESSYLAMRAALEELWEYARYRDAAFRDLLGILDAATRHSDLGDFEESQRDILRNAFQDLPLWHLGVEAVDATIEKFAEFGIDITGPIRQPATKKFRVVIEEID